MAPSADTDSDHESASMMADESQEPEDGAMKVDNISIRPAENGGFIVSCSKSQKRGDKGPGYQSKDYAFGSLDDLHLVVG